MYGLSLMASLLCASATRRFASATLRMRSSEMAGVPAPEPDAGVGPLEMLGEGVLLYTALDGSDAGTIGTLGTGAASPGPGEGRDADGAAGNTFFLFMAASLAAISARF